jgi:hypothetical protein
MKIEDWAKILKENFREDWEMFGRFLVDEEGLNSLSVRWIVINRKIPKYFEEKNCWTWYTDGSGGGFLLYFSHHFDLYPSLWNQLDKFDYEFCGIINNKIMNYKEYKNLSQAMRALSAAVLYYIELGAKLF